LDFSGQEKKELSSFWDFWTFQDKGISICLVWGIFEVPGQNNNDLPSLGNFGRFRPKDLGFVQFGGFLYVPG
jgi:hypothetical protein